MVTLFILSLVQDLGVSELLSFLPIRFYRGTFLIPLNLVSFIAILLHRGTFSIPLNLVSFLAILLYLGTFRIPLYLVSFLTYPALPLYLSYSFIPGIFSYLSCFTLLPFLFL